ncbi:nuclear GTPase SLIP-GC-like [Poecilia formosa]|uniref:nuclear GTPase SLIP-GC-like n=1 Tax=Poecilia formosa TaxID=48698 RepID=UPI000443BFCC|nr:PREDICTED: nuclear GTPase SLIP-GC-like [Poecilia formosa]
MDDFVRDKLRQWGLSAWIYRFRDQEIDTESFFGLEDEDIKDLIPKVGPRVRFKRRLKSLRQQHKQNQETEFVPPEEMETSSYLNEFSASTSGTAKRKLEPEFESSEEKPAAKQHCGAVPFSEARILSDVKKIMVHIHSKLFQQDNNKLNNFLKNEITKLSTDKREMVGVFGKTGAGKSSLINAVIGQANLLPIGDLNACTSVMIKVEANMEDKYEAEIEFITKEEWQDEVWSMWQYLCDHKDQENDDEDGCQDDSDDNDDDDYENKLSALYGKDRKQTKPDEFMDPKNFREIPEFLQSKTKTLTFHSAEMLSEGIAKYTKNDPKQGEGKKLKRLYWPLVKCVTVKVPNIPLLQHVTLVDLPGNGDRNKSRDQMWKEIVGKCSTVWIVADITRSASEIESWQILKSTASLMGNGGECQNIHFICTKSDVFEDFRQHTAEDRLNLILDRNMNTKLAVKEEFKKLHNVKKHFSEDNFEVFTVSSKEFLVGELKEHSEIPKLQKVLQDLNDCHSETLNYVSGAYGILSLIQGTSLRGTGGKTEDVYDELEKNKNSQLELIKKSLDETYSDFEKCLNEGVEKSKSCCENTLRTVLYPRRSSRAFWRTLQCVVQNGGIYKPRKKQEINLNMKLTSPLANSIDEEFRKTFPTKGKNGPFNGVINKFSLDTEKLKSKYSGVDLLLNFLKTEEEKIQSELNKVIRDRKKTVYNSLTKTIEESMQECYKKSAGFSKTDTLKNIRETIETHVKKSKDTMFDKAKDVMLTELKSLEDDIVESVKSTMEECLELSFRTDDHSIPDVSTELGIVEKLYDELKRNTKDAVN